MIQLPPDLAQAIHDYLVTRPMREVEGLVNALRECRPQEAPKDDA
jgi:hypothetical protein